MAERIGWDRDEIILLIDACDKVSSGQSLRAEEVQKLSKKLRQRAIEKGLRIDSLFRNENGISLQMNKMEYFLSNKRRGLPGGSKHFAELADFRIKKPKEFQQELQRMAVLKSGNNGTTIPIYRVKWNKRETYAGTNPVSLKYKCCQEQHVSNWKELYVLLMKQLIKDYPNKLRPGLSLSKGTRIDIGSIEQVGTMTCPRQINTGIFLETNMSANDIIHCIKNIFGMVQISPNAVTIKYKKGETGQPVKAISTAKTAVDKAPAKLDHLTNDMEVGSEFSQWMENKGMAEATVRSYTSAIRSAEAFAREHHICEVELISGSERKILASIDKLLSNKEFIQCNKEQHNRFSVAFRKLRDYIAEINCKYNENTNDIEVEQKFPFIYKKLLSLSKVYDDPDGLTIEQIADIAGIPDKDSVIIDILNSVSWATRLADNIYSFSKKIKDPFDQNIEHEIEPTDYVYEVKLPDCTKKGHYQFDIMDGSDRLASNVEFEIKKKGMTEVSLFD